ncbi:MAG: hypothetical protein AVDCRST_MAG89-4112 [uncultured Gemmatimonadetes bacterium]|uniref:Uncharacterized protein n=1 Tax=uncultured Gemmatimonadota bacterium TaxID=203437 RepID=A0A6J4MQT9_9BACT|nr:MAG: hypothetical protein AVDCRST_MAG89-4112 [uncultured Gemmatimonadota bacterium]
MQQRLITDAGDALWVDVLGLYEGLKELPQLALTLLSCLEIGGKYLYVRQPGNLPLRQEGGIGNGAVASGNL